MTPQIHSTLDEYLDTSARPLTLDAPPANSTHPLLTFILGVVVGIIAWTIIT